MPPETRLFKLKRVRAQEVSSHTANGGAETPLERHRSEEHSLSQVTLDDNLQGPSAGGTTPSGAPKGPGEQQRASSIETIVLPENAQDEPQAAYLPSPSLEIPKHSTSRAHACNIKANRSRHVAASLLLETYDSRTVFIAKNNGFSGADRNFIEDLESSLKEISNTESFELNNAKFNLWNRMTDHYKSRLQEWAGDLRQVLKEYNKGARSDEKHATPEVQHLKNLLDRLSCTIEQPDLTDEVRRRLLVDECYDIHSSHKEEDIAGLCLPKLCHKLWLSISFMGRLRTAYKVMIRAAERLSGFESLKICPVELWKPYQKKNISLSNCWSLAKAFESLREDFSDFNVKRLFKQSKSMLIQKFGQEQKRPFQIHAEVQLILHIMQPSYAINSVFKYIGCSKRSCLLCDMFVTKCGNFGTRGCHGKISSPWTIPEINGLSQKHLHQITMSLKSMEKELEKRICDRKRKQIQHKKESTVGGSSVATKTHFVKDADNPRLDRMIADHLHYQRMLHSTGYMERMLSSNSAAVDKCNGTITQLEVPESTQDKPELEETEGECDIFISDEIPDDPQTLDDYGFSCCETWNQKSHLLGLYKGLLVILEVKALELDQWRCEGRLVENIIAVFNKIPERSRGKYFPWFLRHTYLLDDKSPPQQDPETSVFLQWIENAKSYLPPEDRKKDIKDLQPVAKRDIYIAFASLLHASHPHPEGIIYDWDMWYDLGFCVCRNEHEEGALGSLYNKLIRGNKYFVDYDRSLGIEYDGPSPTPTCTFEEFWRAYESGKLIQLMDHYGLKQHRSEFKHLDTFLSGRPGSSRPSIWRLQHVLALRSASIPPQLTHAARQYGLTQSMSAKDKINLTEVYDRVLSNGDPMELHRARCKGEVLIYVQSIVKKIEGDVASILKSLPKE
ncbi:hypothetical protein ETB97_008860 [Aspergillus alliaceus]|uniref:Uncharacterized protein n=1 Tax=Petromyces alliaceus TaxID=209559 RepID=A0A8H5ZUY7_PETAA|nr:hypothetical protein ETB97_008860 [Aspergillus burnettii]